ncbi:MAG: SAM-dependent methyltransferase, partial [Ferrovibrionaceae bacterium]
MTIPTAPGEALGHEDAALVALGRALISGGYRFTTVTPETHRRVLARRTSPIAADLADVFGWSCPFDPLLPPPEMLALMDRAGILQAEAGLLRARIRCSTLGNQLFVHSAYPTTAADAVFFGPDTYRFVRALLPLVPVDTARIVDIGAGSGAGGLAAAAWLGNGAAVVLGDINDAALRFSAVNAAIIGLANVA